MLPAVKCARWCRGREARCARVVGYRGRVIYIGYVDTNYYSTGKLRGACPPGLRLAAHPQAAARCGYRGGVLTPRTHALTDSRSGALDYTDPRPHTLLGGVAGCGGEGWPRCCCCCNLLPLCALGGRWAG